MKQAVRINFHTNKLLVRLYTSVRLFLIHPINHLDTWSSGNIKISPLHCDNRFNNSPQDMPKIGLIENIIHPLTNIFKNLDNIHKRSHYWFTPRQNCILGLKSCSAFQRKLSLFPIRQHLMKFWWSTPQCIFLFLNRNKIKVD